MFEEAVMLHCEAVTARRLGTSELTHVCEYLHVDSKLKHPTLREQMGNTHIIILQRASVASY
jgi:hypothetical protein